VREWTATGIGSLAWTDAEAAARAVLEVFPELPHWPQLPRRSASEGMVMQAALGLGFVEPLDARGSLYRLLPDKAVSRRLEELAADRAGTSLGPPTPGPDSKRAAGFLALLSELDSRPALQPEIKGQWVGPATLAAAVVLDGGTTLLDRDDLLEGVLRAERLAVLEQVGALLARAEHVHLWLDEPLLGSAAVAQRLPVPPLAEWYARLAEACGPRVTLGVHCCAPPPWEILLALGVPVLSFDAWRDLESVEAHTDALRRHAHAGGSIAWGIVPALAEDPTAEQVVRRLRQVLHRLDTPRSTTRFLDRGLVTPSCGLAALGEQDARARMHRVSECAALLRRATGVE
jgi:hypothetical protein